MTASRRSAPDPGPPLPHLGDVLEFIRLVRAIDHGLHKASRRMAVEAGITGPQRLVLHLVGRFPGVSAGQIAATLHLHPSTLTGILVRLERLGLLARRADPRDARRAALGLTPEGRRLNRVLADTAEPAVQQVLADLPNEKVLAAREVLETLAFRLGVQCTPDARETVCRAGLQTCPPVSSRTEVLLHGPGGTAPRRNAGRLAVSTRAVR